jgi:hypothetical protein
MKTKLTTILISCGLLTVVVTGFVSLSGRPVTQSAAAELRISITEGRPLAQAAALVQLNLGTAISYEDPPWIFSDDIVRAAETPWGAEILKTRPNFNAVVPKNGTVDVRIPMAANGRVALMPEPAIQKLLDDHGQRNNPGKFRVQRLSDDYGFAIVPISARDANGRNGPVTSPLDSAVFFEEADRTGLEALNKLFEAVGQGHTGYKVEIGIVPNHLAETRVRLGARGDIARDVLVKLLNTHQWSDSRNRGVIPKMSWRLFFEPKGKFFVFNLVTVQRQELDPSGRTQKSTVSR